MPGCCLRWLLPAVFALLISVCRAQTLISGRTEAPPRIDGEPADGCWLKAMAATDFSVLGSGGSERALRQTTVRAAWDARALYLHAVCLEPDPASITAAVAVRDGEVWMEDAVEVFLQPDTATVDVVHFVLNAHGVVYDERNGTPSFDAAVTVAAAIGDRAWHLEVAIPWAGLRVRPPEPGAAWGFNVTREHRPREPREWSTWAPLEKGRKEFGVVARFGRMQFAAAPSSGRASGLSVPGAVLRNPVLATVDGRRPDAWSLAGGSTFAETAPHSLHYAIRNDRDYGMASQPLDLPVSVGDVFTVLAVLRGSPDAAAGIAIVQEMADGRPDDLYPFWNLAVSEDFRLYSGRIVVDTGAKRLRSVNVYRANRGGSLEVAYVEMLPGRHGVSDITEAARCTGPEERGLGVPWSTPSPWGLRPLPGGPLKTLLFIGEFQRDAVELAQRLDLDFDLVYCPTFRGSGKVDQSVAFEAERILSALARHEYQLVVLAGLPSNPAVIDGILRAVRAGVGLLVIEPLAGGGPAKPEVWQTLADVFPKTALPADAWRNVFGALDGDALRQTSEGQTILRSVAVGEVGAGRVLRLTWSEAVPGLIPFRVGVCEYWEYRWAALCKAALWAARRVPPARLVAVAPGEQLGLRVEGDAQEPLEAVVEWDTRFGVRGATAIGLALTNGIAMATLPVPPGVAKARGPAVARVLLRRHGQPLDVAACVVPSTAPAVALLALEAPKEARSGAAVPVAVTYRLAAGGTARLAVEAVDAYRRVVARTAVALQPGASHAEVTLPMPEALSVYHRVVATAQGGAEPVDRLESDLLIPDAARDALADFSLGAGYAAMRPRCPEYLRPHLVAFLRANGITACSVDEPLIRQGMLAWGGTVAGVGMTYKGANAVREPCFSDPARLRALVDGTVAGIGKRRAWGFVGYNMSDEVHLAQDANVEVCTCGNCQARFREWAQAVYGTVDAANREWGTRYESFAAAVVPRLPDLKGTANPSRWVDFRLFMDQTWASWYAAAHDAVRVAYPDARLSFTNPYKFDSLSGTDFALWAPHEDVVLRYCHRNVLDRHRAWSRAPVLSWFGYRSKAVEVERFVWWFALNGGVLPIWWDPLEPWAYSNPSWGECSSEGFTPWYLFDPLWRQTERSRAVTAAARDLQTGLGRLLRVAAPVRPQAAILHSQPSLHTLYAESAVAAGRVSSAGYTRYAAADDAFAAALKRRGIPYTYLLAEPLAPDLPEGLQLIALPACIALSDATVAALRAFADRGGTLLADVLPATYDEHGKPRDASPLASVFSTSRNLCLGASASAESAAAIDAWLEQTPAARSPLAWRTAAGTLPRYTQIYRFGLGTGEYIGLVREAGGEARGDGVVRLALPGACFAYDCRQRIALGRVAEISADLPPGAACFFALLPYAPTGLEASATIGDGQLTVRAALAGVAKATDHVFRVEVTPPGADSPAAWYCRNVLATAGSATIALPLALNDPSGAWRITVRDVATGLSVATVAQTP